MTLALVALVTLFPDQTLPQALVLPAAQTVSAKAAPLPAERPVVVIYLTTECPIANRYAPVIEQLYKKVGDRVTFLRAYPLGKSEVKEVVKHSRDYKHTTAFFLDGELKFARAAGLRVSPEAVLLDAKRNVIYRGRIDGRNIEHGRETKNFRHDLAEAIDEHLAGKPISEPSTLAQGCFLPFRD